MTDLEWEQFTNTTRMWRGWYSGKIVAVAVDAGANGWRWALLSGDTSPRTAPTLEWAQNAAGSAYRIARLGGRLA